MGSSKKFHTKLRDLRKARELTQKELGAQVRTSKDTIRRLENEEGVASYEVLFRIARYFDEPVEQIFWYE